MVVGIVPARYGSTRFLGKPLVKIGNKTMIERVYAQASLAQSLSWVAVATDDKRIFDAVVAFGGRAIMTKTTHENGTSRCAEAVALLGLAPQVVINIQGDEPFIEPEQIDALAGVFLQNQSVQIATLIKKITEPAELLSPNCVKAVVDNHGKALYFSRAALPHHRDVPNPAHWLNHQTHYKHIGLYGYKTEILQQIAALPPTDLEQTEALEQLRWLQHGYTIHTATTQHQSIAIDTPADLERILQTMPELLTKN